MRKRNKHVGSSLDEFLKEEGILAETRAIALKGGHRLAGSADDGEGEDHQDRNGEKDAHAPRRVGPPACVLRRSGRANSAKLKREIDELKDLEMENRN